jgi:hypothetical protein
MQESLLELRGPRFEKGLGSASGIRIQGRFGQPETHAVSNNREPLGGQPSPEFVQLVYHLLRLVLGQTHEVTHAEQLQEGLRKQITALSGVADEIGETTGAFTQFATRNQSPNAYRMNDSELPMNPGAFLGQNPSGFVCCVATLGPLPQVEGRKDPRDANRATQQRRLSGTQCCVGRFNQFLRAPRISSQRRKRGLGHKRKRNSTRIPGSQRSKYVVTLNATPSNIRFVKIIERLNVRHFAVLGTWPGSCYH